VAAAAAAAARGGFKRLTAVELPGGIIRIDGMVRGAVYCK
jgi:hypothetical protein